MLQNIRDRSQGLIAKVVIGLIVAVFALFGVESIIGGFIITPPVAEVNGEEITETQLQAGVQSLLGNIGAEADSLDPGLLERIALNQLIDEALLLNAAADADMTVSSDRLDRSILETPQFQIDGAYDGALAARTIASQGYSVPGYRDILRRNLLFGQVVNGLSGSGFVTEPELRLVAELIAQTRDFRYIPITPGARAQDVPIGEDDIAAYYDANQAEFAEEETVTVDYVLLDKDAIAEEIEVGEAELIARYEAERAESEGASERRASHILFGTGSGLDETRALEAAAAARERLDAGEEFAALARELSSDAASARDGGDIGYTDGAAFPEPIETALERLEPGEISGPVITEFGVHLVMLTEGAEGGYPAYEEVAARIEREAKSAEVDLLYAARIEDLSNLAFETGDLRTISEELGLAVREGGPFGREGGVGLFADPGLAAAAWSDEVLLEGNNSDAIEVNDSQTAVLRVKRFAEASVRPLEEARAEIAVLLRARMERDAASELGRRALAAAEAGEGLEALLEENGLEWVEANETGRAAFAVNREIVERAFGMPVPQDGPELADITLANGAFVLIELNRVNPGDLSSMSEAERETMTASMRADLGNGDFQAYMANLRENANIRSALLAEDGL